MAPELFRKRAPPRQLALVLVALASRVVEAPLTRQRFDRLPLGAGLVMDLGMEGVDLLPPRRAAATLKASSIVSM